MDTIITVVSVAVLFFGYIKWQERQVKAKRDVQQAGHQNKSFEETMFTVGLCQIADRFNVNVDWNGAQWVLSNTEMQCTVWRHKDGWSMTAWDGKKGKPVHKEKISLAELSAYFFPPVETQP